ncbi:MULTISPECIES: HPr family phosphocarrier protein [Bacillus]|uniref:HPr family phosphocarrier protein n=1 Tax=Bacillus TaxID=1386 RepID=UPI0002E83371|nr:MULTISPECIES: HPr family phosphocarrier protein [Bacillus]
MLEKDILVTLENGLHARPAAELVKKVRHYSCHINLEVNRRKYDVKSILGLMSASIKEGDQVKISTDGEDEEEAMKWISEFLGN